MNSENKSCKGCQSSDNTNQQCHTSKAPVEENPLLKLAMGRINHKIVVLSGKGGVGKSTVAVNLALSLVEAGKKVGLVDVDIHGPSVPKLLGIESQKVQAYNNSIIPIKLGNLKVMSIGFILEDPDQALIWRGPMKMGIIKQFLEQVDWGDLDYLVVDCPPGTGDEPLSIVQLIGDLAGAVVVTTPQELSIIDVRKSINFCAKLNLPVLGVIENMSGFVCPKCGEQIDIFKSGGGERMAAAMKVPFLGKIPLDPAVSEAGDAGEPYMQKYTETVTANAFKEAIEPILNHDKTGTSPTTETKPEETLNTGKKSKENSMRIVIPVTEGRLSMHFGHCAEFELIDVNLEEKTVLKKETVQAPEHEPGLLPRWLHERGANIIIAGGMGQRAQQLFAENNIKVIVGAPGEDPDTIVKNYLEQTLQTGDNVCDH